jgi:hypothetical protein
MVNSNEILRFISQTKEAFQKMIDSDLSAEEKQSYQYRIDAFSEVENWITWRLKSSDEKQITRIRELATMRKIDALPTFIKGQEKMINLYGCLKSTSIYIEALHTSTLDNLKIFCEELMNLIDFKPRSFSKNYPTISEINEAFKPYFEITKPAKGNGNMFEECYEKIELLYNELMKLHETA